METITAYPSRQRAPPALAPEAKAFSYLHRAKKERVSMPKYRRGSGSVYLKRGWCYIKYYANGKPVYEATGTKNKKEARGTLHERLGEIAKGEFVRPAAGGVTFDT